MHLDVSKGGGTAVLSRHFEAPAADDDEDDAHVYEIEEMEVREFKCHVCKHFFPSGADCKCMLLYL